MDSNVRVVGRYALYNAIAAGGMATVHLGRLLGPVGFSRTVAIKRLHAQFASDPEFVSMFLDEARLAARIRHPNVVQTVDVVATSGELFLVMDYVPGESVARLMRALRERQQTIPLRILSTIMAGALHGLHAAHEAKDERGHPLGIVHRDVSPQNVILGTDGTPRVLDFGVAKAAGRVQTTREGQIKGKLSYMPPEQLRGASVDRKTDIYAAGVMLWELLTGQRLFAGDNEGAIVAKVLEGKVEPPSQVFTRNRRMTMTDGLMRQMESLDQTILKALSMDPVNRHTNAREMAIEIERKLPPATASECADWLESIAKDVLATRAALIAEIESSASHVVDESHIMSVLNAKATLGPSSSLVAKAAMDRAVQASNDRQSQPGPVPTPRGSSPLLQTMAMHSSPSQHTGMHQNLQMPPSNRYPMAIDGPPVTNPSSISVSTHNAVRQQDNQSKRNAIAAMIGVFIGAAVLLGGFWYHQTHSKPLVEDVTAGPPPVAAPADSIAAAPPASIVAPIPIPPASVAAVADDSADAGVVPHKAVIVAKQPVNPPAPHAGPAAPAPKPAPAPAPAPGPAAGGNKDDQDCTTPYWYGPDGLKHYKPHCLGK